MNRDEDEFPRNQSKTKHQRERKECSKAQHLAKHHHLSVLIITNRRKYRLCNLSHRIGHKRVSLRIPIVGLRIVAHIIDRIKTAEDKSKHIGTHRIDDIGNQKFDTESEHLPDGSEIYLEIRSPARIIISSYIQHKDKNHLLPGKTPISHLIESQHQTYNIRTDQCHEIHNGNFLVHHVFHHVAILGNTEGGDEEA